MELGRTEGLPNDRHQHALVVGGTGMLAGVSLGLAARGYAVAVIARNRARLAYLEERSAGMPGGIYPLPLDYRHSATLRAALDQHQRDRGPVELAICWIHSVAPEAAFIVADAVARNENQCRFFHVLGSAGADPLKLPADQPAGLASHPGLIYRQIILGFVREGSSSRWLSDDEISAGVLDAIELDAKLQIVGTVMPWESRP